MDWRSKARLQRVLGRVPFGMEVNYLLQRHVTHTYPRTGAVLDEVIATAERHRSNIERHVGRPVSECRTFEFGAGWDLATPLALAALGVGSQVLVDLRPVARADLVRGVIAELVDRGLLPGPAPTKGSIAQLLDPFDIVYRAPADARASGLAPASIDAVVSTSTLEHVGRDDMLAILAHVRDLLRPDGICSFAIDYHDHYAGSDSSIHGLHFLRFTEDEWRRWNCPMQFQNRLRHPDYVELFEAAGFQILEVDAIEDHRLPGEIQVSEEFRRHSAATLRIADGWFVLRPR